MIYPPPPQKKEDFWNILLKDGGMMEGNGF